MILRIVLVIILSLSPAFAERTPNPKIDALFQKFQEEVPGASVTVIQEGHVAYQQGYGMSDLAAKTPVTPSSNFRLASLTKQFTAMAILILIARKKLDLETKLASVFPDFPKYGKAISIRHLLNHIGGLLDYEDLIPSGQTEQVKDKDVLALMKHQSHTYFTPGSQYRYSNTGYAVLAMVVEKISGQPFASFLKENIFDPLKMKNTVAYELGVSTVENRAFGYTFSDGSWSLTDQSTTSAVLGDGGIYTSVEDWFLWDQALYTNLLIPSDLQALAFTPGTLNNGSKTEYGFGWVVDTYRGLKRQSHTGSTVGFRSAVVRFPERRFTVTVLVNRANAQPWEIAQKIGDAFLFGDF